MRTGPGKKADKVKSPKADKAPSKKNTTWDPFRFGGAGATGEEAKSLERGPKSPKPGSAADEDLQVILTKQFTSVRQHSLVLIIT